jgi:hypothetical protein
MLTYADEGPGSESQYRRYLEALRVLTYADVCCRMMTYADEGPGSESQYRRYLEALPAHEELEVC